MVALTETAKWVFCIAFVAVLFGGMFLLMMFGSGRRR
jgi:hypothetical protein